MKAAKQSHRTEQERGCAGHHHPEEPLPDLTEKLRRKSRKITGPRQAILEVLRSQAHPLTNKEIHAALPERNCDLATIYRSMHLLEQMGMVQRFDFGDGIARFELIRGGPRGHHHHLICVQCSEIIELEDCCAREWDERIAVGNGYKAITHKLEFFGICPGCQTAAAP